MTCRTDMPYATIEQSSSQLDPTSVSTIHFNVTWNEAIDHLESSSFIIIGTATTPTRVLTGGPLVYDLAVFVSASGYAIQYRLFI
jgi:hypothetical protein